MESLIDLKWSEWRKLQQKYNFSLPSQKKKKLENESRQIRSVSD